MTVTALVISDDLILRSETRAILAELDIVSTCFGFAGLERAMRSGRFDCIFLDFVERDKALLAVKSVRSDKYNRYAILFALTDSEYEASAGISYMVCRSMDFSGELKRAFLSARSLVLGEKRRYQRYPVDLRASCACGDRVTEARIVDLSERGACLEFPFAIVIPILQMSFVLPGIEYRIETDVKVMWRAEGKVGIQFVSTSESSRTALRDWLTNQAVVCA